MLRWSTVLAVITLCLCAGCIVQSVHPLFDATDQQFDAGLVGSWTSRSGQDRWVFSSADQLGYGLTYTDENGRSAQLLGRLVSLGGAQFLDVFPGEPSQEQNILNLLSAVPVHTLWRLDRNGDSLQLTPGDMKWLDDYLQAHPDELAHEYAAQPQEKDWLLITARTPELRSFFAAHHGDAGLFETSDGNGVLTRTDES